ncbi:MAG: GNAT family N-acetyltransferase [Thermoplasmata archaeon]
MRDVPLLLRHRYALLMEISTLNARTVARYLLQFRRWMVPRLQSEELIGFIVEDRALGPVGSGCLWVAKDFPRLHNPSGVTPYVLSVFVEPVRRRRGVATRLLRELIRAGRATGGSRIRLHASPEGRRLYRNLGFERTWEMRLDLGHRRRPR